MRYIKAAFFLIIALFVFAFVHYTLPQRDIVRIVGTYEERQSLQGWTAMFWGKSQSPIVDGIETRDVQFIQSFQTDGKEMVYRNEDTGWGWPPYFKFDTASLYTKAADAVSDKNEPEWVIVTHYGWRSELLSIFPNATEIKPATGPDQKLYPWKNIAIIVAFLIVLLLIRRVLIGIRRATIDPLVEDVDEAWDSTRDRAQGITRWFKRS